MLYIYDGKSRKREEKIFEFHVTICRDGRERGGGDKLPTSSDCRDPKFALSISILSTYLSHPSHLCICPSLWAVFAHPGSPGKPRSPGYLFLRAMRNVSQQGRVIDSAIYYHLISHPTRLSFVLADTPDGLTVRQHLVVGDLTFSRVNYAKLEVHRAFLFLQQ